MAAQIVNLARLPEGRMAPLAVAAVTATGAVPGHVWRGASGRRYAHAIYSLLACPPIPHATYLLVQRDADGTRAVLHVGHADDDAPTLNLARIRQRGATLGANEVHVYGLAGTEWERGVTVSDLRAGLLGSLAAEPSHAA